jgi:hypothetical protein
MDMRNLRVKATISILIILLAVGSSYAVEYVVKNQGLKTAKVIKVSLNNQPVAFLDVKILKQISDNPTLASVLGAAGVNDFKEVEIKGLKNDNVYHASKEQVNDSIRFTFTDQGSVNLRSGNDPVSIKVDAVSEINTKN